MFYVAFGPNKQDFHSLRETFILNLGFPKLDFSVSLLSALEDPAC